MRIALLTTGRFWLVDLGRELATLGHDVRVYSLVPPHHTARHGLPAGCGRWLGPYVAPLYLAMRAAPRGKARELAEHALVAALDRVAAELIEPCDALIAMSGIAVRSLDAVQQRYGARVFLERGSHHILSQRAILEAIPGVTASPVPAFFVERELAGYGFADCVTVPAAHVAESFLRRGFPSAKLFHNPFGVDLGVFSPTPAPAATQAKTIIMTGAWSLRKGCDVLVEAWRRLPGVQLLHVGPVLDAPLPGGAPGFQHFDAVPQHELPGFYARAHVFALASREEGLALVQVQALACGLPLVCTTRTGGADLGGRTVVEHAVSVVPPDDPERLAAALARALAIPQPSGELRDLLGRHRESFSWAAYAKRYESRLRAERLADAASPLAATIQ